ncbi:MAG: hypothetical protein RR191_02430 [Cetobacterium sp.]|uniref:hypothetical protein n=1 Tax=unclassified Cetobacterium TaxID=2630983 RepID=UPI00163CDB31|nr:hypothetical protein [Cetobacterium sp. 2A]MBC2855655.1 hypothetical protein [Cetobacterium sp. 2A]
MKKIALLITLVFLTACSSMVRNYDEKEFLKKYDSTVKVYDETLSDYMSPKDVNSLEKRFKFLKVQLKSNKLSSGFVKEYKQKVDYYSQTVEDLKD